MGTIARRAIALAAQRQRLGIRGVRLRARGGQRIKVRAIAYGRRAAIMRQLQPKFGKGSAIGRRARGAP